MKLRSTHSLATLPISKSAYEEIKLKLKHAEYHHVFLKTGMTGEMIDMQGIALVLQEEEEESEHCVICDKPTSSNREGQYVCYECSTRTTEEIEAQEELSKKDKNYLVKEIEVDFEIKK